MNWHIISSDEITTVPDMRYNMTLSNYTCDDSGLNADAFLYCKILHFSPFSKNHVTKFRGSVKVKFGRE